MNDNQETKQQNAQQTTNPVIDHPIEKISHNNFGKSKKLGTGLLAILLVVGLSLTLSSVSHQTNLSQHASGPEPTTPPPPALNPFTITNLNSTTPTLATVNADGTMGPQSADGNWSNTLPAFLKGKLAFAVTDPVQNGKPTDPDPGNQGKKPTDVGNPNVTLPVQSTHTMPTQAQDNDTQGNKGDHQTVTSLKLTITKVEVHIAYQGIPGDQANNHDTTSRQNEHPTAFPSQQGQAVDHWETLTLPTPVTIDLVQLAKTKNFSTLGFTTLAVGRYTEVRLYIKNATATVANGTTVTLAILGKDNIVRVVKPFTIAATQTTKLTMDFDAQHSVVQANGQWLLKPVVARLIQDLENERD